MKLRPAAATLATAIATALALPLAAHAATYEPASITDPVRSASNPGEPANPGIDIASVRAARTGSAFTVATKYAGFTSVSYSRRLISLVDPTSGRGRLVEYRTAAPGTTPKVVVYRLTKEDEAIEISCPGARVTIDAAKDRLTVTLPASCYPWADEDGATLYSQALRWNAGTWRPGPVDDQIKVMPSQADSVGGVDGGWTWTGKPDPIRETPGRSGVLGLR